MRDDGNVFLGKSSGEFVVEKVILLGDQRVRARVQSLKTLHAVIALAIIGLEGRKMRIGTHLKHLIQIGARDAQIPKAFHQWHIFAASPLKHAAIEGEQALIAIQIRGGHLVWQCE